MVFYIKKSFRAVTSQRNPKIFAHSSARPRLSFSDIFSSNLIKIKCALNKHIIGSRKILRNSAIERFLIYFDCFLCSGETLVMRVKRDSSY